MTTQKIIKDVSKKIVERLKEKDVAVKQKEIEEQLSRLVTEFGMPIIQAEQTITKKEADKHGIILYTGSTGNGIRDIKDLVEGEWVTIEVLCVKSEKVPSESIFRTGIFADATGAIRFTAWARKKDANGTPLPDFKPGTWYRVENCVVNTFNNAPSLGLTKTTSVSEIPGHGALIPTFIPISALEYGIVSLRGKVTKLFNTQSDKVAYSGVIGDETGTLRFVLWSSELVKGKKPKLVEGESYEFRFVQFGQDNNKNDLLSISADIMPLSADIEVKTNKVSITGTLIQVGRGSGLIRRCPVEGCNMVLRQRNFCNVHEFQKTFNYDMRIKGYIDTGNETYSIIMPKEATEEISGMTMEEAIKIAESDPIGADAVMDLIHDKILGRYFTFNGSLLGENTVYVTSATPLTLDEMVEITGIPIIPYGQQTIADEESE